MDLPLTVTCPLTGRVGSYVPGRDRRPSAPRMRGERAPVQDEACPFCTGDVPPEPSPARAERGDVGWTSCPNLYPAVAGPRTAAQLAYAERHGPPLTSTHPASRDDWGAMLDVQQQLARRGPGWSLLVANVGPTAGASQTHPHGQVLDLPAAPAVVVQRTRLLATVAVAAAVLADDLTVAEVGGLRLVVPAVPYGPGDLRIVPEADGSVLDVDPDLLAGLVVWWTTTLDRDDAGGRTPADAKLIVHDRAGDRGRWYADLLATGRHGPVAGVTPFAELDVPPRRRAAELRDGG
jgi:hypothetical protein